MIEMILKSTIGLITSEKSQYLCALYQIYIRKIHHHSFPHLLHPKIKNVYDLQFISICN